VASKKLMWTGRVITILIGLMFVFSAVLKLLGLQQVKDEMTRLGFPERLVLPLGILELTCVVIYLIPQTALVGAILLTGYLGGAICTHWRIGDPFYSPIIMGILVWVGLYLREDGLRLLMPLRRL
jgi:DoxX-like family